jgi:hypothetical protein
MRERDGEFRPNKEVDQVEWMRTDIVNGLLTSDAARRSMPISSFVSIDWPPLVSRTV